MGRAFNDMLGNVWEWCEDAWREKNADAVGDKSGAERVILGGSWYDLARYVRAAYRYWAPPDSRYDYLGFRCLSSGIEDSK